MPSRSFGLRRRRDIDGASERGQDLKCLAELRGRFACLEIDDEAQADAGDAGGARELVLPQASGLAGGSNDVAYLGGGDGSSCHDLYRSGKQ
jgi:hypothetical protein